MDLLEDDEHSVDPPRFGEKDEMASSTHGPASAHSHVSSTGTRSRYEPSSSIDLQHTLCGYGKWRPKVLQTFNSPNYLVFFLGLYALILGFIVNGVNSVNMSSVERRFNLPSARTGLIASSYDVSAAVLAVVIGFYGSGKRKARLMAIAILISAVGSITMAMPHFTAGTYSLGVAVSKVCSTSHAIKANCSSTEGAQHNYLYVLLMGQLLHGVGGTTLFTVGVSLIDDSVPPNVTPFYLGIVYGLNIVGAGLGYIIGGQLLNIYVDFDTVGHVDFTPKDPRWVGAWWLGPVIAAVLQLAISIPISLFGAELPGSREIRKHRIPQAHRAASQMKDLSRKPSIISTTLTLLRNPCFVFVTLAMTSEGMFLSGTAAFLPKFVENGYGVSQSKAAVLTGMTVVPAAALGLVMGGYIANRFRFTITQTLKYLIVTSILAATGCSVVWIRCETAPIYGVSEPYPGGTLSTGTLKLVDKCNIMCECDTNSYEPVCNNYTALFFSPCFAGCTSQSGDNRYEHCACVEGISHNVSHYGPISTDLTSGSCREPCNLLYVFGGILFAAMCVSFLAIAPGDAVQLRCVSEEHKVYAQGVKTLVVRMLGSFMGPILMGKLLDLQCTIWREKCGHRLSCWIYDHEDLVKAIYFYILTLRGLSVFFCSVALKFYRPPTTLNGITIEPGTSKEEMTQVPEMAESAACREAAGGDSVHTSESKLLM